MERHNEFQAISNYRRAGKEMIKGLCSSGDTSQKRKENILMFKFIIFFLSLTEAETKIEKSDTAEVIRHIYHVLYVDKCPMISVDKNANVPIFRLEC